MTASSGAPAQAQSRRMPALDLLRFAAALAVVLFHYSGRFSAEAASPLLHTPLREVFKYGYLGVQLFFMISGFVIAMSMAGSSARGFVAARLLRLWPAFFICGSLTALALLVLPEAGAPTALRYLANLTMAPALLRQEALDTVYWTLLIELKFYAWMALLLALGWAHRPRLWAAVWLGIAVCDLLVLRLPLAQTLFVTPWAPHFAAGVLLWAARRDGPRFTDAALYLGCAALAVWLAAREAVLATAKLGEPTSAAVAGVLVAALFAGFPLLALRARGWNSAWTAAAAGLGAASYPLYLIHNRIGQELMIVTGLAGTPAPGAAWWPGALVVAALTGGAAGLAWLIARHAEAPLRSALRTAAAGGATRLSVPWR